MGTPGTPETATSTSVATDREEYYAVMDNTTKLSQRRQTTNDILTGVNVFFLTGMGATFVSSHLTSWWLTAVFGLITVFAWLFNITWLRLLHRYKTLIGLRIRYLEALEEHMRESGVFVEVAVLPEKSTQPVKTRGVYSLEKAALYQPRRQRGFIRRERFVVLLFMLAYLVITGGVAALTQLIASNVLPPVRL